MSGTQGGRWRPDRRRFLTGTAGLVTVAGSAIGARAAPALPADAAHQAAAETEAPLEPFWGAHQSGIITPPQNYTYFAAFDLTTKKRDDVIRMLRDWTNAAARMTSGMPIEPFEQTEIDYASATVSTVTTSGDDPPALPVAAPDTGETYGLPAARLTLTFGFGAGLFVKDENDRYELAKHRPEALVDMPRFVGDQLVEPNTGGDLSVQACANDPQVAFHAVRQLARLGYDIAQIRWVQTGFMPSFGGPAQTPRNLMGFKDGTNNPAIGNPDAMDALVWVGNEGPDWMRGGSYLVVRRIRVALEHWDRTKVDFQEQTMGRHKATGAPLGMKGEFEPLNLDATDKDGNPIIPESAHVRLAAAASNGGAQILRRPYSYNDGVNFTAERWPPWRQGMEYDAGLFFVCYQRDPRTGFIKIFEKMSKFDMLNQFVTHVGGGFFACPKGIAQGEFLGQRLFDKA